MNINFWKKNNKKVNEIENLNKNNIYFKELESKNIKELEDIRTQYRTFGYNLSQYQEYNPDPLVLRKTLNVFDDMYLRDTQIKAAYNIKRQMVVSNGFDIVIDNSEDEKQIEFKKFLKYILLDGYNGLFSTNLYQLLTAFQFGFSVTEKVFKIIKEGEYKGKIGIEKLITRPPHGFLFYLDDFGNVDKIIQNTQSGTIEIPKEKILIYTYDKQFQNLYGVSDFTVIYQSYFAKLQLKKFMNIYAERYSIPPIIGKYPPNNQDEDTKLKLTDMLSKLQSSSIGVIPEGVMIESLKTENSSNADFYIKYLESYNKQISRGFLMPELMGYTDHTSGSQALGREQFDLFMNTAIYPEQAKIEDLLNEELIKPIINYNFGIQDVYPKFSFNKPESSDKLDMFKIWIDAVSRGVVKATLEDENIIRNDFGFGSREEEEEGIEEKDIEEEGKDKDEDKDIGEFKEINYNRKLTEFEEQNINLKNTVNSFETLEISFANDLSKNINDIRLSLEKKIINEKIIIDKKFNDINNLVLKSKQVKQLEYTFNKNLEKSFNQSIKDMKINIKKAEKSAPKQFKEQLVEFAAKLQYNIGALQPAEAIKYLKSKKISLAGTEEDFILKNVKQILQSGLTNGKSESETITQLENFFETYNVYQFSGIGNEIKNINDIKGRLATVVRTNIADAYNKGDFYVYNDPNIKEIIGALQYSAILDSETTDFCINYDGRIYKANDNIWDTITPPNHYNCRSITVPIYTFNDYEVSSKLAKQPAVNFGG